MRKSRSFTKVSPIVRSSDPNALTLKLERTKTRHHEAICRKVAIGVLEAYIAGQAQSSAKATRKWEASAGQEKRPLPPKPILDAKEVEELRFAVRRKRARQYFMSSMDASKND